MIKDLTHPDQPLAALIAEQVNLVRSLTKITIMNITVPLRILK